MRKISDLNKILQLSSYELAREQLSHDLLYQKIPPERIKDYISTALAIGAQMADSCPSKNIYELCAREGIRIVIPPTNGQYFGVRLRAEIQIDDKEKKILLYRQSLAEIARVLQEWLPPEKRLDAETVKQMHLAHEFFHYLEYRDNFRVNEMLPPVVTFNFLGLRRTATVLTLSEIAAHSFSKRLLDLPYYPYLYDKIYALSL
ncbi:MAG TPA: hypothetical protein GX518_00820 [Firmicutes bacterium]|nr:hypothetical protein [Bacillota bacterium]